MSHIRELHSGKTEEEGLWTEQLPILQHVQLSSALCGTVLKGSSWEECQKLQQSVTLLGIEINGLVKERVEKLVTAELGIKNLKKLLNLLDD